MHTCVATPPHKSFPTCGGFKLASPKLRLILSLIGKESSFLPQKCKANLPTQGMSHAFFLACSKCTLPQAQLLPKMHLYPSPQREGFFPLQNAKSPQILPHKLFFVSLFIYLFIFSLLFNYFFFFFPKTWNSSPKWKSYSPAFGANNRRIDTPVVITKSGRHSALTITCMFFFCFVLFCFVFNPYGYSTLCRCSLTALPQRVYSLGKKKKKLLCCPQRPTHLQI